MFKVYEKCCQNCLLSADAIVSPKRRKDILNDCAKNQSHFICHKATIEGKDICCRKFYDDFGHVSQMIRIAERLNSVEFVPQSDSSKLPSYKDLKTKIKK